MTSSILVLFLGLISSATLIIAALSVHRPRLLVFSIITNVILVIQYELVGSIAALAVCAIGLIRMSMVLGSLKKPWLNHWAFIPVFLAIHATSFYLLNDWSVENSWINFIPIAGGMLSTVAFFFKKVIVIKATLILIGVLWIIYEFNVGIYGQMIGESLNLLANVFAFVTLYRAQRAGIPEEDIEDVDTHIIDTITSGIPIIKQEVERTVTGTIRIVPTKEPAMHR